MKPEEIVSYYGTQVKAAAALGVDQSSISNWCTAGKVPLVRQYQVQLATRGKLKADKPAQRQQQRIAA